MSRMSSFDGSTGDDQVLVLVEDGEVPFRTPSPINFGGKVENSLSVASVLLHWVGGVLDVDASSEVGFSAGDLEILGVSGSSSSISNMRSTVESFGRILGLKGAL